MVVMRDGLYDWWKDFLDKEDSYGDDSDYWDERSWSTYDKWVCTGARNLTACMSPEDVVVLKRNLAAEEKRNELKRQKKLVAEKERREAKKGQGLMPVPHQKRSRSSERNVQVKEYTKGKASAFILARQEAVEVPPVYKSYSAPSGSSGAELKVSHSGSESQAHTRSVIPRSTSKLLSKVSSSVENRDESYPEAGDDTNDSRKSSTRRLYRKTSVLDRQGSNPSNGYCLQAQITVESQWIL